MCKREQWCEGNEKQLPQPEPVMSVFHQLWDKLHREVRTRKQYDDWLKQVPQVGCGCQNHWQEIAGDPTDKDLADPWWGFDMHNSVNKKLSKPLLTEEAAIELYGWPERVKD